ncbi:pecanex-like protein 1 [Ditylenchus destructor]|nr:pecanex-like protein 1 [Ditylenchus destructor]
MTIGNHLSEIARQGVWASLTGGWCFEPSNSIFCNTVHLYIWMTLLILPILLGKVAAGGSLGYGYLCAYVVFIVVLFCIFKILVAYLHKVFDSAEPIIVYKTQKSSSIEQAALRSPVSSFSARATESNAIEMIDLGGSADRPRHRQMSNATSNIWTLVEDGDAADKLKHVRIGEQSGAIAQPTEADFLSELFPNACAKMSSIFENDDNSSSTSSKDSTNELLGSNSATGGFTRTSSGIRGRESGFLLPADSLELLPIAPNNRRPPNSTGSSRRNILPSRIRRKYSESDTERFSVRNLKTLRRRSEEKPFTIRRVQSSSSDTRIGRLSALSANRDVKSSLIPRKAYLVRTGSGDIFVNTPVQPQTDPTDDWPLGSSNKDEQPCCSNSLCDTDKVPEKISIPPIRSDLESDQVHASTAIDDWYTNSKPSTSTARRPGRPKRYSDATSNRKPIGMLHRTSGASLEVGHIGRDSVPTSTVGDLKGQITRLLEELIEKHPETLDAIENVRMSRLGGSNHRDVTNTSNIVSRVRQSITNHEPPTRIPPEIASRTDLYTMTPTAVSTHVAYSFDDTTTGAIHSFQDEHGNWWTYSFDDQSSGIAQALGSSRAIYEMFNRRRDSTTSRNSRDEHATSSHPASRKRQHSDGNEGSAPYTLEKSREISDVQREDNISKDIINEADMPSTSSHQPTTVNIIELEGSGSDYLAHPTARVIHRRSHSSTSSTSDEANHSSRYIANAPSSILHPMGGVSFTPTRHKNEHESTGGESGPSGHRRHQSDSASSNRQLISFMSIASRLYNQASGSVLYPGMSPNIPTNIPSALALVAAAPNAPSRSQGPNSRTGRSSHDHVSSVEQTIRRFGTVHSDAPTFHDRRDLSAYLVRGLSRMYTDHDNIDTVPTIASFAAAHPNTVQTSSLPSVSQSARIFADLHARGTVSGIQSGLRSAPMPNRTKVNYYYRLKFLPKCFNTGEGLRVKLNRLSVGALFDRNNSFISGVADIFLATMVSCLTALLIANGAFSDFSLLIFAFVVAGSQFSLLKSVQPDAASPIHGFNWLVAYSRPVYFCIFAAIILLHNYIPTSKTDPFGSESEFGWYWKPAWLRLYTDSGVFISIKDLFSAALLLLPIAFTIGLLPQVDTLAMHLMEQLDMHLFGATASFSLLSAMFSLSRSITAIVFLSFISHFAYEFDMGSTQNVVFSAFVALTISVGFLSSRWSSNPLVWRLLLQYFRRDKDTKSHPVTRKDSIASNSTDKSVTDTPKSIAHHSPNLPERVQASLKSEDNGEIHSQKYSTSDSSSRPNTSGLAESSQTHAEAEERQNNTVGTVTEYGGSEMFSLDDEKCSQNGSQKGETLVNEYVGAETRRIKAADGANRSSMSTDPMPESMKRSVISRFHHDLFYFVVNTMVLFGIHSTSLFLSAQPYFEKVIFLLCIIFGVLNHHIYPQLRTHTPWKLFARPILKPFEFNQFETTVEAKLTIFERIHVWMLVIERNILIPLLVANMMTTQAWKMPFLSVILMALCSFRLARTGYAQPQLLTAPLIFTFSVYSTSKYASTSALFVLYVLAVIWPKVQECILKLQFIFVYIAPWQISWGSAFHAFAQPFTVPHSGLVAAIATVSSIISAPLNPFLGSSFFILSYIRPIKFWEKDYNTKRIDHSTTRLQQQLDRGPMLDDSNLNAIFYEHLARSLQSHLAGDLMLGRWATSVQPGDCFILASLYLNCLIHIIEVGNGFITFQVRGLEFRGTYCHQREVEAISEDWTDGGGCCCCKIGRLPGLLSFNNAWSLRWLAWEVVAAKYVIDGYSITDNSAVNLLQVHELRRLLVTLYVKCMIYYAFRNPNFDKWINNETILSTLRPILKNSRFVESDQMFCAANDEDYDLNLSGVSKQNFMEIYGDWIEYCLRKRQPDLNSRNLPIVVSFSFALSILGRRALGTAAFNRHANAAESFLFGLHALFKGDMRITSPGDEWVFSDPEILTKVISPAVRMALKLHQDHFAAADDLDEMSALFERIQQYQTKIFISHEHDPAWRDAIIANTPSLLALRHMYDDGQDDYKIIMLNKMHLNMRVIKLNRECVRAFWAGQQQELIFLRNRNPERGSIQNARQVLRNMINSSADQPIGYPIYVSPLITSFVDTHAQIELITGKSLSFCTLWSFIMLLFRRLRNHFGTSGSSNLPTSVQAATPTTTVAHTTGGCVLPPPHPLIGPTISQAGSTPAPYRKHTSLSGSTHSSSAVQHSQMIPMQPLGSSTQTYTQANPGPELELKTLLDKANNDLTHSHTAIDSLSSSSSSAGNNEDDHKSMTKSSRSSPKSKHSRPSLAKSSFKLSNRAESLSSSKRGSNDSEKEAVSPELKIQIESNSNTAGETNSLQEPEKCTPPSHPYATITDASKVFNRLNEPLLASNMMLVSWPNEKWRLDGGKSAWTSHSLSSITEGMTGTIVHIWSPFHPSKMFRSHAGVICLLRLDKTTIPSAAASQSCDFYVPIQKEGLEIHDTDRFRQMFGS